MSEQQNAKYLVAVQRFYDAFGWTPFFDGMDRDDERSDGFINKINQAVENNDPDIDVSDYFPDGRNL